MVTVISYLGLLLAVFVATLSIYFGLRTSLI